MARRIWGTREAMPFSQETLQAAANAEAAEITTIPNPAHPEIVAGLNILTEARVPLVISTFQAKAALLQAGLLDTVESLMANPITPPLVKLAWVEVQEFRRDSPMIASMADLLGWSSAAVDDLFIAGERIIA